MPGRFFPVNYSAGEGPLPAVMEGTQGEPSETVPTSDQLTDWTYATYNYDISTAANLGFPIGSVNASVAQQVLIFESAKYKEILAGKVNRRYGVAIRALLLVAGIKFDASLNLAAVAAKVQLNEASASAQLTVRGYKGDLGALLPKWQHFGVDEYTEYLKSISDIQAKIMSDPPNIVPELIGSTEASPVLPAGDVAVGMAYALDGIKQRHTLLKALGGLGSDEARLSSTVKDVYGALGLGDQDQPTQQNADDAHKQLGGIHVGRSLIAH